MSAEREKAVARPRRRWFQFSLGSLLVVMTVFAIWFGIRMDRARRQERAVAVLSEKGDIVYESVFLEVSLGPRFNRPSPEGPKWPRALLGDHFFDRVRAAWLTNSPSDDDLKYLGDLPDIESLIISSPQVTGSGIEHLCSLPLLKELHLGRNSLIEADLVHIEPLQELRYLSIICPVSDEAFDSLATLKRLEMLRISSGVPSLAGARADHALDQTTELEMVEEPLASVLDYLMDFHNIGFPVDEEEVRRAGIEWDGIPVTATISKQNLERTLDLILQDTGLDWILTPNGILITTEEKAAERLAAVRDLKKRLPNLKRVICFVDP